MMTRRHLLATGMSALGGTAALAMAARAQGGLLDRRPSEEVPRSATFTSLEMGRVALTVNDLAAVQSFYEQVIGLERLAGSGEVAELGAGGRVLLELREDRSAPRPSVREAGLYHTAFLLPSRAALGRWVRHVAEMDAPIQGASDHLVSEAVYLADPEGNGIEVYADRPRDTWVWTNGMVEMDTLAFDVEGVVNAADGRWTGAPEGTTVGHVHLQVGDLEAAQAFYSDVLGFDVVRRRPAAVFLSSGRYHHHLGANIFNSEGASRRSTPVTGLADVQIQVDASELDVLLARNGGQRLDDPWGTSVTLVPRVS